MAGINTREDLAPPSDQIYNGGHPSVWEKASQMQPSHFSKNTASGNSRLPVFTPAIQHQGSLGQESPHEPSFFQSANRANCNSLREPTDICTSVFQRANRGRDVSFEYDDFQSSQNHLAPSNVFSSFESLHKASLLEKQKLKHMDNEAKASSVSDSASAHPIPKKVPVFKPGRSKASNVPLLSNIKKRLTASSEEGPAKKHAGLSFHHSTVSAFKPVVTNGTSKVASVPSSLSAEDVGHQNIPSNSQGTTLPRKPMFGRSQPCLSKKIKEERNPHVAKSGREEANREGSDTLLSSQFGERSESKDDTQTETVKEELCVDENESDVTGSFGKELESEVEDSLTHTPIQSKLPGRKTNKAVGVKKNLPNFQGSKKKKLHEKKVNQENHKESNQGKKKQPPGITAGKKRHLEVNKSINTSPTTVIDERTINESHPASLSKTNCAQIIPNKTKKKPFKSSAAKKRITAVKLGSKKKAMKNYTSTSTKQQTTKADLAGQMENTHRSYTDDPSYKPSVSEDLKRSALNSSPLSHDTTESSLDSFQSRSSEMSSFLERERSFDRDRYEEESDRLIDEEITSHSESGKENVLQLLNSVDRDMWVQCDRCSKWRKLTHILDPTTLPDRWYCSMLPVPGENSCQVPEENWNAEEPYIYYEHQLVAGSVVWAQVPGSPWWPAMVDIDPDYKRYDWFNSAGTVVTSYHVTFFGEPVTRAWVTCRNIRNFKQQDSFKKFIRDGKKDPSRDNLLRRAVEEAVHALSMEVCRRRRTYTFVVRYKGNIRRSSHVDNQSETLEVTAPLKTSGHRKKIKASRMVMEPTSVNSSDTVDMNDDFGNVTSQSSQDNEIANRDQCESRLERQEQCTDESFNKQNLSKSNSDEHQLCEEANEGDDRSNGGCMDAMTNSTDRASEMKFLNRECSKDYQYINMDECHETGKQTVISGNANNTRKNKRHVPSKMTKKKNLSESYTSIEKVERKIKGIDNENVATSENHYETGVEENKETDVVHQTDLQDNEDTLDSVDGTDLQENEDFFDSLEGTDLQENNTLDSMDGTNLKDEDIFDTLPVTNIHYDTTDNVHQMPLEDNEDTLDSVDGNNDECENNYKEGDLNEQYDAVFPPEHDNIESEDEKYNFERATDEFHGQDQQDCNDEYNEQDNMECNYEQDTSTYEEQDDEANCQGNEYTLAKNTEYVDGQNEDSCEAPCNYDYDKCDPEQDTGHAYEGQDIDNNGDVQNYDNGDSEDSYEHQEKCDNEEQELSDDGESECNGVGQEVDNTEQDLSDFNEDDSEDEHKEKDDEHDKMDEYEMHDYEEQDNDPFED